MKKDPTKSDSSQKRSTTKRESINALPSKDLKNSKIESQSKIADLETTKLAVEQENKLLKRELKEAAQTIAKYKELYHLAPIGYISLSKTGQIIEVNLTAAQLLNKEEVETKKFTLTNLILEDSKPVFNHFLWQIFTMNKKETCELKISTKENQIIDIQLTGLISPTQEQCLVTITDVTDQKRVESELHKWATLFQPKGN
jgi:PAS domain-containing protein